MKVRESVIEEYLLNELDKNSEWALKLPTIYVRGLPDRLVLRCGSAYFVELKAPGHKPRRRQTMIHRRLSNCGFTVHVLSTRKEVDEFIDAIRST